MSAVLEVTLRCDAGGCAVVTRGPAGPHRDVGAARRDAKRVGWRSEDNGDVCPVHAVAAADPA